MNSYNKQRTYNGVNDNRQKNRNLNGQNNFAKSVDPILTEFKSEKLSLWLKPKQLYLPNELSYKVAEKLKNSLNTTQLRKFFSLIKEAEKESDFDKAKNSLYRIIPLVAYSVGRNCCGKLFYDVIIKCVNETTLKDLDDVKCFITFIESIVAYSKFLG